MSGGRGQACPLTCWIRAALVGRAGWLDCGQRSMGEEPGAEVDRAGQVWEAELPLYKGRVSAGQAAGGGIPSDATGDTRS